MAASRSRQNDGLIEVTARVLRVRARTPDGFVVADLDGVEAPACGEDADGVVRPGDTVCVAGRWSDHPKHGRRFAFAAIGRGEPADRRGALRYLAETCPGVGDATAAKLYDRYGDDAVRVLREEPGRVAADGVIADQAKAEAAALALHAARANEAEKIGLAGLLHGHGFPRSLIAAAIKRWKGRATAVIRADPFALLTAGLAGAGFTRCDKLYLGGGGNPARLKRLALAAWHALDADGDGDTWHSEADTVAAARRETGRTPAGVRFDAARAVECAVRGGWIVRRRDRDGAVWYATREAAEAERRAARRARMLLAWERPRNDTPAAAAAVIGDAASDAAVDTADEADTRGGDYAA